jgi:hypothetical protein
MAEALWNAAVMTASGTRLSMTTPTASSQPYLRGLIAGRPHKKKARDLTVRAKSNFFMRKIGGDRYNYIDREILRILYYLDIRHSVFKYHEKSRSNKKPANLAERGLNPVLGGELERGDITIKQK